MITAILDCLRGNEVEAERHGRPRRGSDERLRMAEVAEELHALLEEKNTSPTTLQSFLSLHYQLDPRAVHFQDGKSSLTAVAGKGNEECAALLITRFSVNVNAQDKSEWGQTALHRAVKYSNDGMMRTLLNHGSDPNAVTLRGACTALHWAASRGAVSTAKILLDAGADVNARDDKGCTPLRWATVHHEEDMCAYLASVGAYSVSSPSADDPGSEPADHPHISISIFSTYSSSLDEAEERKHEGIV